MKLIALTFLALAGTVLGYTEPNCGGKQVMVHLFEWSWDAIANECEEVLGPKGYCGVQISPPMEHINYGEWWARYQPVSYILTSRSGNREQLESMVQRCNAAGVAIYADMVINHMAAGGSGQGTAGSNWDGGSQDFGAVPFSAWDFHQPYCEINDYNNVYEVRNCYLVGLNDLDGGKDYVRDKIAEYANDLLGMGMKGFRVDASKHMWPGDLEAIQGKYMDVDGNRPFVVHEVIDHGGEAVSMGEYFGVGKVTEFNAGSWIACIRDNGFDCLSNYGSGLADGLHALTFVDNHDNQRGHGGAGSVLTHKDDYLYKLGSAFHLAHDYGFKRVMSSYYFDNTDQGPPGTGPNGGGGDCGNGWVCEHRWSTIGNMVQFANAVAGEGMDNWQIKDGSLGFSRGTKGFFAMGDLNNVEFYTGLPDGEYCDIIHDCQTKVQVSGGMATLRKAEDNDPVVAFCVGC